MATIVRNSENEIVAVSDIDQNANYFIETSPDNIVELYEELDDEGLLSEVSQILEIPKNELSLQSGIKYKYAWQVDENGVLN